MIDRETYEMTYDRLLRRAEAAEARYENLVKVLADNLALQPPAPILISKDQYVSPKEQQYRDMLIQAREWFLDNAKIVTKDFYGYDKETDPDGEKGAYYNRLGISYDNRHYAEEIQQLLERE